MLFAAYLRFIAANRRLMAFGFFGAFSSSFGQTYFIGVFGPSVQSEFDLSHTAWGTIYMLGTLASAVLLPWTGKQIDRVDLARYTTMVCALAVVACATTSLVAGAITLAVAIMLLRQSGQGLMSHIALTSMARYFDSGRGRAIAVATLGFAAGEAVLPFLAVLAIGAVGWRWTYAVTGLAVGVALLPVLLWLLRGHAERHRAHQARLAVADGEPGRSSWTRAQMLRDPRFYLLLPGVFAPSLILTAMFFHHLNVADAKGWSHAWITGSYVMYAAATVLTSLAAGRLVDRFGALRIVPYMLVPLFCAMLVLASFDDAWAAWPYLVLAGVGTGVAHTVVSAMWAELYGVAHLGAIRSLGAALGVFASALGPVTMGGLMDAGASVEQVCLAFAGHTVLGSALIVLAVSRRPTVGGA